MQHPELLPFYLVPLIGLCLLAFHLFKEIQRGRELRLSVLDSLINRQVPLNRCDLTASNQSLNQESKHDTGDVVHEIHAVSPRLNEPARKPVTVGETWATLGPPRPCPYEARTVELCFRVIEIRGNWAKIHKADYSHTFRLDGVTEWVPLAHLDGPDKTRLVIEPEASA